MSDLLDQAFTAVSQLPDEEREAFAAWILEELSSEQRWQQAFAHSANRLDQLADEALAEHHSGSTQSLDPKRL
jgi:hypothetical protein